MTRDELITQFKEIHVKYLETLTQTMEPGDREDSINESKGKFDSILSQVTANEVTNDEIKGYIASLEKAISDLEGKTGLCSFDCLRRLVQSTHSVLVEAKAKLDKDTANGNPMEDMAQTALLVAATEISSANAATTMIEVFALIKKMQGEKIWKVEQEVHKILEAGTDRNMKLADAITNGKVHAHVLKLSTEEKVDYKPKEKSWVN